MKKLLHQPVDGFCHVAKVLIHNLRVKLVVVAAQDHFLHLFGHLVAQHCSQIDSIVLDGQELVHHGLIRPLVQQGRHGVVPPVYDQQLRGQAVARHFGHELLVHVHLLLPFTVLGPVAPYHGSIENGVLCFFPSILVTIISGTVSLFFFGLCQHCFSICENMLSSLREI